MSIPMEIGEKELEALVLNKLWMLYQDLFALPCTKVLHSPPPVEQNGVTEPARNSKCGQIWEELDLLAADGVNPTLNQIQ